jgi:ABC-2 type transport system ATP-binding protein
MLTAAENLRFFGRIYGMGGKQLSGRVEQLLRLVGLHERGDDRVVTYSVGMKRRLNLAVALVHSPKLILLDEPTAGVDPHSREEILQLIRRLRDEGNAILYTTHYMDEAEALCNRLCILNRGKVVAVGTLDTLVGKLGFSEVIELKGVSARSDLSAIRALRGVRYVERGEGVVRLFVKQAADFLEPLHKIVPRDGSMRLRIVPLSLESLFLRLTSTESTNDVKVPNNPDELVAGDGASQGFDSSRLHAHDPLASALFSSQQPEPQSKSGRALSPIWELSG